MPKLWVPNSEFIHFVHEDLGYIVRHNVDHSCTRKKLLIDLESARSNNDIPGIRPIGKYASEKLEKVMRIYLEFEGTITVLYTGDEKNVH